MIESQLTESCYSDRALKTLTNDVCFFISENINKGNDSDGSDMWWPKDYTPGLSVEDWQQLISDATIFNDSSLEIMKRILDYGGEATCTQLSKKYGESINFYNIGSSALAKRIVEKTDCPVMPRDEGGNRWWSVLYFGKNIKNNGEGTFMWKLRDELAEALKCVDLSNVKLYSEQIFATRNSYTKGDFLREVYMSEDDYDRLSAVLKRKMNIILQGAPGVGKTFAAKRLAYSMMGEIDDDRIEFIQFHQNYSYEDFVMGYKPVEDGFQLKYGIFYRFCEKASNDPNHDYYFIIDEINRGNMSKIFGELLMLIEAGYRDDAVTLAYNGLSFSVPRNIYIIGMMNTADRSLAMIDYALRRRFSFFEIEPAFNSDGFIKYQKKLENETFNNLIERIKDLNKKISDDKSLGKGFCIGHSYFSNMEYCTDKRMKNIIDFDILPMLSEYWFDETEKLEQWNQILHGIFQ